MQTVERAFIAAVYRQLNEFFISLTEPEKKDTSDLMFRLDDEILWQGFGDMLRQIFGEYLTSAGQVGTESAAAQTGISMSWERLNPRVAEWAETYAGQLVTQVTQGTRDRVRDVVVEAMQSGAGWQTVREKLSTEFSRARAERIARTEVIRAHTQGALQGYQESGVVEGVRWLDGQNGACPLCKELHNQTRPTGQVFYRDRFGDGYPPRHPHCRCAISPVVIETDDGNENI